MARYVVIGGGVSGLAAARLLAGADPVSEPAEAPAGQSEPERRHAAAEVLLLEASDRLGGKVLTGSFVGGPVELGPDQFLRRDPSAERLCRLLGLGDDLVAPGAGSAAVVAGGRPRQLPAGLVLGIPADLGALAASGIVSPGAVDFAHGDGARPGPLLEAADVGLDAEPERTGRERSAGAILRPRLGDEIVDRLVDPLIGGINAGSIDDLSLGVVAPQIARALVGHRDVIAPLAALMPPAAEETVRAAGAAGAADGSRRESPFFGLAGGLGRLVAAVEDELGHLGCTIRLGCPALRLRAAASGPGYVVETPEGNIEADGVVVALPAAPAAAELGEVAPGAAELLGDIAYGSVAVVTLAFDLPTPAALAGWSGVLVPRVEGTVMTAVTLLSQKWPWTGAARWAPPGTGIGTRTLVRVSAGRHLDGRIDTLDDAELSRILGGELAELTSIEAPPTDHLVQRWTEAFPQYAPGYAARVSAVRRALEERPGIALAGATLGGIGIPACLTSGERAARAVLAAGAAATL